MRSRRQSRVAESVEKFTKRIYWFTLVVTIATVINVGIVLYEAFCRSAFPLTPPAPALSPAAPHTALQSGLYRPTLDSAKQYT